MVKPRCQIEYPIGTSAHALLAQEHVDPIAMTNAGSQCQHSALAARTKLLRIAFTMGCSRSLKLKDGWWLVTHITNHFSQRTANCLIDNFLGCSCLRKLRKTNFPFVVGVYYQSDHVTD